MGVALISKGTIVVASPVKTTVDIETAHTAAPRNNQLWLVELRGECGKARQMQAYQDLAKYLYKVAYNYLLKRQSDVPLLAKVTALELAASAQDHVQDVLFKLAANDHALLDQYQERGRFLSWTALIIRNHIAGILRRPPYTREIPPPATFELIRSEEMAAVRLLTLEELGHELQDCLDTLPQSRHEAVTRCILLGEPTKLVARDMKRTINATDQLVFHAKRQLKKCLESKGIGSEILHLFR